MANNPKRKGAVAKPAKRSPVKRQTERDVLAVPTAKQIEESISRGTTVKLTEFVKGVKL